ncbi:MAG: terpene cyclase/mutase family protein [Planctomycetes bacterium]|nr:terpene cyclase/mutase family protein [Planctomycetota bacterium]
MPDNERIEQIQPDIDEKKSVLNSIAQKSPWWVTSFVVHAFLVVITLFWYVGISTPSDGIFIISEPTTIPPQMEKNEKDFLYLKVDIDEKIEHPILTEREEERNESPSDQPFEQMEGDSLDKVSDKPLRGYLSNDAIAPGGGVGGGFGGPGGLLSLRQKGTGGEGKKQAVLHALGWLMRHQNEDGSWDVRGHTKNCGKHTKFPGHCDNKNKGGEQYKIGVTGLAMLAFTGAGFTHMSREKDPETGLIYGETVRKAVLYLIKNQDDDGCFGESREEGYTYNHIIAAFAICEDYFFTKSPLLKSSVIKAVTYCTNAQNPGAGIRYGYKNGDNDSSVTGWLAQVYKSAEMCGLEIPPQNKDGITAWYNSVTNKNYYWVGYKGCKEKEDEDGAILTGVNDHYINYPSLTAIGLMTRIFDGHERSDKYVTGHARHIKSKDIYKPHWEKDTDADFYYWYYASYAMFQMGGDYWKWWEKGIGKVMLEHQNNNQDCSKGSWEPVDKWSFVGGRVYTTAMGALILEVYDRFPNVFQHIRK